VSSWCALSSLVHTMVARTRANNGPSAELPEDGLGMTLTLKQRGLAVTCEQFLRAVKSGDQSLVDLFVQAGVNIRVTDREETPVLILAMKHGYSIIANLLIKAGVDVNATDRLGVSPLLLA